jgi:phage FluMu gp28-like protein
MSPNIHSEPPPFTHHFVYSHRKYFLSCLYRWILDDSPLKIIQKSRQVGISHPIVWSLNLMDSAGAGWQDGVRFGSR